MHMNGYLFLIQFKRGVEGLKRMMGVREQLLKLATYTRHLIRFSMPRIHVS